MNAFDMIYRLEMNKERINEHEEMSGPYKLCKFKIKEKKKWRWNKISKNCEKVEKLWRMMEISEREERQR